MTFLLIFSILNFSSTWQFLYIIPFALLIKHLHFVKNTTENKAFDPELKKVALSTFVIAILFFLGTYLSC